MAYYTGDSIPLKFTVTDAQGPVTPSAAKVTILKPDASKTMGVDATIVTNTVSYTVPGTVTAKLGKYETFFVVTLSYGERTHRIDFMIEVNP